MMEVDHVLDGTDGPGTKPPAALCSLPRAAEAVGEATQHRVVTAAVPASHGHETCHHPLAWGARAVGEPILLPSPGSSQARPQALGHKTETSRKLSPPPKTALAPLSCWLALGDL